MKELVATGKNAHVSIINHPFQKLLLSNICGIILCVQLLLLEEIFL